MADGFASGTDNRHGNDPIQPDRRGERFGGQSLKTGLEQLKKLVNKLANAEE